MLYYITSKWTLEQPSGGIDRAAKGTLNVDFSEAMMASHSVAEVTQAPIAGPFAATMMGLGKSRKASNSAWLLDRISECSFLGFIGCTVALRLTPAQ